MWLGVDGCKLREGDIGWRVGDDCGEYDWS